MPVDLEFQTTHSLSLINNGVEIRIPTSFSTTVRNRTKENINITFDVTDPVIETRKDFVSQGSIDFIALCLPYGRRGTMTVDGTGTVFRVDTGAYDTINSGSALLTYDTRQPELIFSDLPTRYEPGDSASADFIVGFNRNVTFDVPDPSNADEVFAFDGPYFGSVPGLYRYTGSGQPRLPLPANLMTATEWSLMHVNDSAQYFAVRFSQVPDVAQGTLNITLRADVALTPDNENSLLAVTLPPPVPAPQTQSIPIIENISTQFLDLTEDFNVAINITGGQANKAYVKGLALGSYAKFDETNQRINIIGNANKLITDSMWRCFASGSGGDATPVNQIFNYVEVTPVVTSRSRQDVFIGTFNEILIPISNNPSDGSVTTELIGLEHELVDDVGNGENTHMRIYGTPPASVNFSIDEGSFSVLGTNTGGDHTAETAFRTSTGQIPSWSGFPSQPSTFYIGENYRLPLSNYVSGIPTPVITLQSGIIPPGLSLAADYDLEGTYTTAGNYQPRFRAENAVGHDDATPYAYYVETPTAPQFSSNIGNREYYVDPGDIFSDNTTVVATETRFNFGTPVGTPSLTGSLATAGIFQFDTSQNMRLIIPGGTNVGNHEGNTYTGRIVITNLAGAAQSNEFAVSFY